MSAGAAGYTLTLPASLIAEASSSGAITNGQITFAGAAAYFDIIFCIAGILTLVASRQYFKREYKEYNEFSALLLFSISGMMLLAHANNLLILFIGVELMSIPFYVLAGYFRNVTTSVVAALKYFMLGAFATGFLLYGIALLYGGASTLDFIEITSSILSGKTIHIYLTMGFGLLIIGLSFKTASFPFHQWAPDVYHGSPTVISGFMSAAGKAAAFAGFIAVARAIMLSGENLTPHIINETRVFQDVIAAIAALTMLIGNITALAQKNIKRMLSYSSVAHAGYIMVGIAANNAEGWSGIVFYSTIYIFMQIGAFVLISTIERDSEKYMEISDYQGLSKKYPIHAALLAIFMFSLAGMPPFAGFIGKYYLFSAAVKADYVWLMIIAVISSIISMYYYIGLIIQAYFKEPAENYELKPDTGTSWFSLWLSAAAIIALGVFPSLITNIISGLF
jgi:NADH-quinone oxidoreductase subunit N